MAYWTEEVKTYKTVVICDDCGSKKVIAETKEPIGFDNRMNGALQNGYSFTQEGSVFKNYCFSCQSKIMEAQPCQR
jgi:predicted dinucleotide-binding enzyme